MSGATYVVRLGAMSVQSGVNDWDAIGQMTGLRLCVHWAGACTGRLRRPSHVYQSVEEAPNKGTCTATC